jgi:hypothetical protein
VGPSGELADEIPGTQIARFEADEKVVAGPLGISGSGLGASVARCDSRCRVLDCFGEEL